MDSSSSSLTIAKKSSLPTSERVLAARGGSSSGLDYEAVESKERRILEEYLHKRNFCNKEVCESLVIRIRASKNRKYDSKGNEIKYYTQYLTPNGSLFTSKADLHEFLTSKEQQSQIDDRKRSYATAVAGLKECYEELPLDCEGATILSWGTINTSQPFHSEYQLFPIGYKCEFNVPDSDLVLGGSTAPIQSLKCEIIESDRSPEFCVEANDNGIQVSAKSEAEVWAKLDQLYTSKRSFAVCFSFFNLKVELLLEGLEHVDKCSAYIFHADRGYGTTYSSQIEYDQVKESLIKKAAREQRFSNRTKTASTSLAEQQKAAKKDDAALKLKQKELREQELEKKKKEKNTMLDKKEKLKALTKQSKEQMRQQEKKSKEHVRQADKQRLQKRREIQAELRKVRVEATAAVIQQLDEEENEVEELEQEMMLLQQTAKGIEKEECGGTQGELLSLHIDSLNDLVTTAACDGHDDNMLHSDHVSMLLNVCNSLHLFQNTMKLQLPDISMEHIMNSVKDFHHLHSWQPSHDAAAANSLVEGSVDAVDGDAEVVKMDIVTVSAEEAVENKEANGHAEHKENDESEDAEWNEESVVIDNGEHSGDQRKSFSKDALGEDGTDALRKKMINSIEAGLDRIQLCMTQLIMSELDFIHGDADSGSPQFPLNQLTWVELARMSMVSYLAVEMGKTDEEIVYLIRGNKAQNFLSSKNAVRSIQCKLANHMQMGSCSVNLSSGKVLDNSGLSAVAIGRPGQISHDFYNEADVLLAVEQVAFAKSIPDAEVGSVASEFQYPDGYRRCASLLLKVLSMTNLAKNFMWEVDSNLYPEYYENMKQPVCLASIAQNLVSRGYGGENVPASFYDDLRIMCINSWVYNSEFTLFLAHAYKLYHCMHIHAFRWLFPSSSSNSEYPCGVEVCNENFCFLSHAPIPNPVDVDPNETAVNMSAQYPVSRCSRCAAVYSTAALEKEVQLRDALQPSVCTDVNGVVLSLFTVPTVDQFRDPSCEWFCGFCHCEDSTSVEKSDVAASEYSVNEWGPSSSVPWCFNSNYSAVAEKYQQDPFFKSVYNALTILSSAAMTSIPISNDFEAVPVSLTFWSIRQRIEVLNGLSVLLHSNAECQEELNRLSSSCLKIIKMSSKDNFRNADFLELVKAIAGDVGASLCHFLLDDMAKLSKGGSSKAEKDWQQAQLQSQVAEGRCILCNASTYEDDMNTVSKVLLCDGCNREAHLHCLDLTEVPRGAWFCDVCNEKKALVNSATRADHHHILATVDATGRDKEMEDALTDRRAERNDVNDDDHGVIVCQYCGLQESDLCSPLVVGQSRQEHDAHVAYSQSITATGVTVTTSAAGVECVSTTSPVSTKVNLVVLGQAVEARPLSMPYFPMLSSPDADTLLDEHGKKAPVVHQWCALEMFKARIDRQKHSARRCRRLVAERAVAMSGLSVQPLGMDSLGRLYWKFPSFDCVVVHTSAHLSPPPVADNQGLGSNPPDNVLVGETSWKKMVSSNDIRRTIELLGPSAGENLLKQNLMSLLLIEKHQGDVTDAIKESTGDQNVGEIGTSENIGGSETDATLLAIDDGVEPEEAEAEGAKEARGTTRTLQKQEENARLLAIQEAEALAYKPPSTVMKLVREKGMDIGTDVTILQDTVFVQNKMADEEDEEDNYYEYFKFGRGGRYYAIGLYDENDKRLKLKKGEVTVIYQVHRQGVATPLSYTPLDEPWSDGMFYFSTLQFKKSGNYSISFICEVNNVATTPSSGKHKLVNISPLVFPVAVVANTIRCGAVCALDGLRARDYIHAHSRHFSGGWRRNISEVHQDIVRENGTPKNELESIKKALILVYTSLPFGSIIQGLVKSYEDTAKTGVFAEVCDTSEWNDMLDQVWRNAVLTADSAIALMQCVLLLEAYINKTWLNADSKLLSSLSTPHFAMRCVTPSAVSLRIFCLDKCVLYDKIQPATRGLRSAPVATSTSRSVSKPKAGQPSGYDYPAAPAPRRSRASQAAALGVDRVEVDDSSSDSASEDEGYGRRGKRSRMAVVDRSLPRRAASRQANSRIRDQSIYSYDDEEEDGKRRRVPKVVVEPPPPPPMRSELTWTCASCTYSNGARARSCGSCGERKPYAQQPTTGSIVEANSKRTRGMSDDEDTPKKSRRQTSDSDSDSNSGTENSGDSEEEEEEEEEDNYAYLWNFDEEISTRENSMSATSNEVTEMSSDNGESMESRENVAAVANQQKNAALDMNMRFLSVLRRLQTFGSSSIFWVAVNTDEVPDYSEIVANPMDLGTVADAVCANKYTDVEEFAKNVRLVWSNCMTYNVEGSALYSVAEELREEFETMLNEWILSSDRPVNPNIVG